MSPTIGLRVSTLVAAAALLALPGFGQRGGTTGTGTGTSGTTGGTGTSTGTSTGTRTPTTPNTNTIPNTTPTQPMPTQPIFVSGRVLLEDGTPPTQSVVIERVCASGSPHAEGTTDSKGYFSFELGRPNPGVMPDASEEPGFGGFGSSGSMNSLGSMGSAASGRQSAGMGGMNSDNRFMTCDLRARLAGYRSQSVSLANHRAMDNPDIGVILLHRIGEAEGSTVSARTLAAPKDARKAYEKGLNALKKKKPADAEKEFQKAVQIDANFSAAWCELGKLQAGKNELDSAHQSFEAAVKADPKFVVPYVELAFLEYRAQKWQALADVSAQAAKLDAFEYPQSYLLNAVANYNLQNFEAAEKSAREAERLDTQHRFPKSSHLLGVILANRQDYQGAAAEFRNYLKFAPNASDAAMVKGQLEKLEQATTQGAVKQQEQ